MNPNLLREQERQRLLQLRSRSQQQQQNTRATEAAPDRVLQPNSLSINTNVHNSASTTEGFFSTPAFLEPALSQPFAFADNVNTGSYSFNYGVPKTSPTVIPNVEYQKTMLKRFDYSGMQEGQLNPVKNESGHTSNASWSLLPQQTTSHHLAGTAEGSDLEPVTSPVSARSIYYSEPSERNLTPGLDVGNNVVDPNRVLDNVSWPKNSRHTPFVSAPLEFPPEGSYNSSYNVPYNVPYSGPYNGTYSGTHNGSYDSTVSMSSTQYNPTIPLEHNHGRVAAQFSDYQWPPLDSMFSTQAPMYTGMQSTTMQPATPSPYFHQGYSGGFVGSSELSMHAGLSNNNVRQDRQVLLQNPVGQNVETIRNEDDSSDGLTEEQRQRQIENEILRKGKEDGLTYKAIKEKINSGVAESTLRGRWRAMSKARKDRVRRPVWTPKDIRLLNEVVAQQLDTVNLGYHTVDSEFRLTKVSWKQVSEYIVENGGSYAFGNATCKKKYMEMKVMNNQHGSNTAGRGSNVNGRGSNIDSRGSNIDDERGSNINERGSDINERGSDINERGSNIDERGSNIDERGSDINKRRGSRKSPV